MSRRSLVAIAIFAPAMALGQPAPRASSSARAAASASATAAPVVPAGHPPIDPEDSPHGRSPHGGHAPGSREPPQNSATDDASLPRGTVVVEVRTPTDEPVANQDVLLGIVEQSVAKGESRRRLSQATDATGHTTFSIPDATTDMAFRLSLVRDGATSAAPPFRATRSGARVVLYAFPATTDVKQAQIAAQGLLYLEPRDEVIQIEGAYRIYNLGLSSWVPANVEITLPSAFKAFNAQKSMDDLSWDGTKTGATFRGTVPPGLHETAFRFQVPNDGDEDIVADVGLLPNVQSFRIMAEVPKGATLEVDGFPPAVSTTNQQGQRILVTERVSDRMDPAFTKLHVRLGGLPTHSKGRRWAALLAALALAAGVWAALRLRDRRGSSAEPRELEQAKELLLAEIARLDGALARGEVGPKTYARTREELLDALSRLIAEEERAKVTVAPAPATT